MVDTFAGHLKGRIRSDLSLSCISEQGPWQNHALGVTNMAAQRRVCGLGLERDIVVQDCTTTAHLDTFGFFWPLAIG